VGGENLEVVHSEQLAVTGREFTVVVAPDLSARLEGTAGVRAWVMDRRSGRDAVGWWAAPAADTAAGGEPAPASQPVEVVPEVAALSAAEYENREGR